MNYSQQLTEEDRKLSTHISDGIYIKTAMDGWSIEMFVSNGMSKSEAIIIDRNSARSVVDAITSRLLGNNSV